MASTLDQGDLRLIRIFFQKTPGHAGTKKPVFLPVKERECPSDEPRTRGHTPPRSFADPTKKIAVQQERSDPRILRPECTHPSRDPRSHGMSHYNSLFNPLSIEELPKAFRIRHR